MSLRTEGQQVIIAGMEHTRSPREIVILAYPDVQSLDVTGPLEVFAGAAALVASARGSERGYRTRLLSREGAALRTSSGLMVVPDGDLQQAPARIDTVIVPGGSGSRGAQADEELLAFIVDAASGARPGGAGWPRLV
jgi:transcriptional regulator GlxA family with amidase domain